MSHSKERHDKNCLNCNTEVVGKYCHICGQENIEPKETVWGLVSHFFYDITHFDGKFFSTTHYLITRPGFLPKEYIAGKRASYLHPIRMYVFSSALFFLVFYSLYGKVHFGENNFSSGVISEDKMAKMQENALDEAKTAEDSAYIMNAFKRVNSIVYDDAVSAADTVAKKDSLAAATHKPVKRKRKKSLFGIFSGTVEYNTIPEYDSAQLKLPKERRDGWWTRMIQHRNIYIQNEYGDDEKRLWEDLVEKFVHSFPYMLFISLPLYALFLKLLYIRRKQYYYVDHGIFLIYLYIFTFIFLLLYFGTTKLEEATDWGWIAWLQFVLIVGGIYYAYKAMRKFYVQGRGKTFMKFVLLNIMAFISIIFLFGIFFTVALLRL